MIEAAIAAVIGPAITPDDPDAAPDQVIGDRKQVARGLVVVQRVQAALQLRHPSPLRRDLGVRHLPCCDQLAHQRLVQLRCQRPQPVMGERQVLVGRQPEAEPELGIILEQRVRPGRAASLAVATPGCDRQVAAIDRGTAGGVGDHGAVTEQLRQQPQVRRLAAPCTGARELEQGLEILHPAYLAEIDLGAVIGRQGLEERQFRPRLLQQRGLRLHVDRLHARLRRAVRGAGLDAELTAGAVLDIDLQRKPRLGKAARIHGGGMESSRRVLQPRLVEILGPDHAVRADEAAMPALDAEVGHPFRHEIGDIALLPRRGAGREGAIHRHVADRDVVAVPGHHARGHPPHEGRCVVGHHRRTVAPAARRRRHRHLGQIGEGVIDRGVVAPHHVLALFGIGGTDRVLDMRDRRIARQHAGDREEASLQHGVGAAAEPGFPSHA